MRESDTAVSTRKNVSAVRLMRIEYGGAFADLLNEKGKGSGDNEMGYVERTLGFRTRDLSDLDLRLVTDVVGGTIRWRRYLDHLISSICHEQNMFNNMEPLLFYYRFQSQARVSQQWKYRAYVLSIILVSVVVSCVSIIGVVGASKYWRKKKRAQDQAWFLKLFEEGVDLEDELGLDI
ncbi:unnamed protein product [Rhodiola kirilowii]